MTFWQENYSFIKEVYDTRYAKMVEWMDNVEMAIQKVCATRVYTSAEYKREKDNFHSLCKNLERAETKRWLAETLETLMKERAGEERKEEQKKLDTIIERHRSLIPRIQETLLKTECYWKCYSYGDDLLPIFEFIDELRNRSVKEVLSGNHEQTEELMEKQDKVLNSLENKRRMVAEFISKGDKLMQDPNCPKFLESHLKRLKEAWEDTNEKALARKKALTDNYSSWEIFEQQKVDCHRQLDQADGEFSSIKKIFDLRAGPEDFKSRKDSITAAKKAIEDIFRSVNDCNTCIQSMLPLDKKDEMSNHVKELQKRMEVLLKTEKKLEIIEDFNKRLSVFNLGVTDMENWLADARNRIDNILKPSTESHFSPEDRVTRTMEIQEDLQKKSEILKKQELERKDIFPAGDDKIPKDANRFVVRLEACRGTIDALTEEVKSECSKFSQDVKFWAEFQTGIKEFTPWIKKAEVRKSAGLMKPSTLVEACQILGDSKNFQEECESKLKILEEAAESARKMTAHAEADDRVQVFKNRWTSVHDTAKEWVCRMTTLVECWNKLEGNVGELSSWVSHRDPAAAFDETAAIPIERLEGQLNQLKVMFAEKQKLVADLEAYGATAAAATAAAAAAAAADGGAGQSAAGGAGGQEGEGALVPSVQTGGGEEAVTAEM